MPPPFRFCYKILGLKAVSHKRESCHIHIGINESKKYNLIVLNHLDLKTCSCSIVFPFLTNIDDIQSI